jgi:predicted acylesterase/phospholipase RssA
MSHDPPPFGSVVLAGGGCRCFWQGGFLAEASELWGQQPPVFAGVSAGATFGAFILARREQQAMEAFLRAVGRNRRNVYLLNGVTRRGPVFPQYVIHRELIEDIFDDATLAAMHARGQVHVLLARPSRRLPLSLSMALGVVGIGLTAAADAVHSSLWRALGFEPEVVSTRTCSSAAQLADLLLQSSSAPPLSPVMRRAGGPVLDGGFVDNVPVLALPADAPRPALVLLTQPRRNKVQTPGFVYAQPSAPLRINPWDYTRPDLVQRTYDQGRRDGARFVKDTVRFGWQQSKKEATC